jgi:hypothetical protein
VAGAARDARRQAPRLGLLVLATACAASQEPPGGPPDAAPPVLVAVRPDSGAVLAGFRDPVVFTFDEVIDERSGSKLENLFLISPRPERVRASWKRSRIEVRPSGGWRPNAVYRVELLPGITDLRHNPMRTGGELIFSTGVPISDTRVRGTVVNWAAARIGAGALVEAIASDSLIYFTKADSTGDFTLRALPPGEYALIATVDENNNRKRDRREAFDSLPLRVDSTASAELWAFAHDTVGPPLRTASLVDSVTVRLEFGQQLRPGEPAPDAVTAMQLPDSTPVAILAVWTPTIYDSVRAAEAPRDTTAGRPDTAQARRDTAVAGPPLGAQPRRPLAPQGMRGPETQAARPDTGRVARLLKRRPALTGAWLVRLARPLLPGGRYVFEARATNVNGAAATSHTVLAVPDSTAGQRP